MEGRREGKAPGRERGVQGRRVWVWGGGRGQGRRGEREVQCLKGGVEEEVVQNRGRGGGEQGRQARGRRRCRAPGEGGKAKGRREGRRGARRQGVEGGAWSPGEEGCAKPPGGGGMGAMPPGGGGERGVQGRRRVCSFSGSRCNAPLTNFDEARVPNPHAVLSLRLRASPGPWEN